MGNYGKTNKASAAQMDLFLETVIEMIVKGLSRVDILRYFTETEDEKNRRSESSVDLYIKKARKELKKRYKAKHEDLIAESLAKYNDLYKKNYAIQDYRECRQVLDSRAKLSGLNAPEKTELTGKDGNAIKQELEITLNLG